MRDYPQDVSWHRRGFRSQRWISYADRFNKVVDDFWRYGFIDADICDILAGNLPEEVLCYLRSKEGRADGFVPEVLAYELDRGNPQLEQIVTDIINGENSFSAVSHTLFQGFSKKGSRLWFLV